MNSYSSRKSLVTRFCLEVFVRVHQKALARNHVVDRAMKGVGMKGCLEQLSEWHSCDLLSPGVEVHRVQGRTAFVSMMPEQMEGIHGRDAQMFRGAAPRCSRMVSFSRTRLQLLFRLWESEGCHRAFQKSQLGHSEVGIPFEQQAWEHLRLRGSTFRLRRLLEELQGLGSILAGVEVAVGQGTLVELIAGLLPQLKVLRLPEPRSCPETTSRGGCVAL